MKSDFDKLRNLNADSAEGFSFECPQCGAGSKDLYPLPVGVSVKPYKVLEGSLYPQMNSDLYNIVVGGMDLGKYYDQLPTIKDALLGLDKINMAMECDGCDFRFAMPADADNEELRRFIRSRFPEEMVLEVKND